MNTTYPSHLTDLEWDCVQRFLPPLARRGRPRTQLLPRILDAIFYILRTGCPWRYLPSNFPPWQAVFYHFRRLRLNGIWHRLYTALHHAERERVDRHPNPSAAIMDSQSVSTVEESACTCGHKAHKCLKGRKQHLLVDTLGLPIVSYITPPMSMTPSARASCSTDSRGFSVQPHRWVVERSFAWLIRNRRLAKDYERKVQTSETLIKVAATRSVLRRVAYASYCRTGSEKRAIALPAGM